MDELILLHMIVLNKLGGEATSSSSSISVLLIMIRFVWRCVWSCFAGLAISGWFCRTNCFRLVYLEWNGMGVQAGNSVDTHILIIDGSVVFGAVLGMFFLGETLDLRGWVGVFLLVSGGIGLISTDPLAG